MTLKEMVCLAQEDVDGEERAGSRRVEGLFIFEEIQVDAEGESRIDQLWGGD